MIFTTILGIILLFFIHSIKKFTITFQGKIFCLVMWIIEIVQCLLRKSINLFFKNGFLSIISMILFPILLLSIYHLFKSYLETKKKED
mgnify:CR=1 FL=1